jgi:16S rRNA C967 or C1407 C5-methylase (RsmB/RsmF family)
VAHDGEWLLDGSDAKLEKIEGPGSPALTDVFSRELDSEIANCRRFWPEETGTQGFFVAKVVKP